MHPVPVVLFRETGRKKRECSPEPAGGDPHAVDRFDIVCGPYAGNLCRENVNKGQEPVNPEDAGAGHGCSLFRVPALYHIPWCSRNHDWESTGASPVSGCFRSYLPSPDISRSCWLSSSSVSRMVVRSAFLIAGSVTGNSTSTRRSRFRGMRSALPRNTSSFPSFLK